MRIYGEIPPMASRSIHEKEYFLGSMGLVVAGEI